MIENAAEFNVLLHAWMQWWEVSHTGNLKLIKQRLQKFLLLTQVSTPAHSGVLSNIKICLPFQMQSASNLASVFIKIAGSLQLHPTPPPFFLKNLLKVFTNRQFLNCPVSHLVCHSLYFFCMHTFVC